MLQGIVYTLLVEFTIFIIWVFFEAKRQIEEDEKTDFRFWEDI